MGRVPGRKLRLLVLNDVVKAVPKPPLLSVIEVLDGDGGRLPCIQNWHQHMQIWGTAVAPEFDLLLVDIKFEGDGYAPDYFGRDVNPYGLVHALPLAARQGLTGMPFVWDIHTGEPDLVKDDPVAQFAFGLLAAMEQRDIGGEKPWKWDGYVTSGSSVHFRDGIKGLGATDPDDRLGGLVRRYRDKLIEQVAAGKLWTNLDEVNSLKGLVEPVGSPPLWEDKKRKELAATDLLFYCNDKRNPKSRLFLQSLFADVLSDLIEDGHSQLEEWPLGKPWDEVRSFVQKLGAAVWRSIAVEKLYDRVMRTLRELPKADERGLAWHLRGAGKEGQFVFVGTVVCTWLELFFKGDPATHANLKIESRITNDHAIRNTLRGLGLDYTG